MNKAKIISYSPVKVESTYGTSFQKKIKITYDEIVSKLGKEHYGASDDEKTLVEWCFEFSNGTVATLYNWKDGKNYDPINGLDKEKITDWHIGGHNQDAVLLMNTLLMSDFETEPTSTVGVFNTHTVYPETTLTSFQLKRGY